MNAAGRPCNIEYGVDGYSKIVFLDGDGNRTTDEMPLPRLLFVDGQFISMPVCPEWIQAPEGQHPYQQVPEGNLEPERYHLANMMQTPTKEDEDLVETCLQALEAHNANKWVVSCVHQESMLRLGSFKSGYVNDEVVHYLLRHHSRIFGLPEDHEHAVLFHSYFVNKLVNVYQEQTLTPSPDELHRYQYNPGIFRWSYDQHLK